MIEIHDYNPLWPEDFAALREFLLPAIQPFVREIHHVGSTSVPGLAAKDIIDISIECADAAAMHACIDGLISLGYEHRGEIADSGRQRFGRIEDMRKHNLNACLSGLTGLRNHLAFRDYLRANESERDAYAAIKRGLAAQGLEIEAYTLGKTDFVMQALRRAGLSEAELAAIEEENRSSAFMHPRKR